MRIAVILIGLSLVAGAAEEDSSLVRIEVSKDMELTAFLKTASRSTGQPLLYDPNGQRIRNRLMGADFKLAVPKEALFDTYRAILSFYELTLVPVGPKGYQVHLVIDSRSTNNFVKNKAVYVDHRELARYAHKDGLYISCAIPIEHIENLTTLRTALSTMVSPAGIGRVHEVPGSNSIVLMDFAPTVAAMAKLIRQMDVPHQDTQVLESIELAHASAKEVADSVQDLFTEAEDAPKPGPRGRAPAWPTEPAPRVIPFRSRNAILVRATQRQLERIRGLVTKLDQRNNQRGAYEVVRLEHVDAEYLATVLTATLAGPATDDWPIAIVAERHTQSLVFNGDRNAIAGVKEIIKQIDVPKPE